MIIPRWTWTVLLQCFGIMHVLHRCQCGQTMDEIIAGAMHTPNGFNFMFDESSDTVRWDMDMLYYKIDWDMMQMLNESTIGIPGKRQAIQEGAGGQRWTSQTIPYEIDSRAFQSKDVQVLQDAMNDWMKYTCLNFRPATAADKHKIKFVDGDGCASYVGMQKGSKQDVLLASGCRQKGTVIHELGHALGLHHEQTRPDRDEYVKIHYDNIPDHLEYNFKKYSWSVIENLDIPYDYTSIMHYGKTYFAEDKSQSTIETLDSSKQDVIGNRVGLSFRDIKTMNKMYSCKPPNCGQQDSQCKGEGFVGKDCQCWCPSDVSNDRDPYVHCSASSGNGNQGSNGGNGDWNGNNNGGGNWNGNNNNGGGNWNGNNNNNGGGNWNGNNNNGGGGNWNGNNGGGNNNNGGGGNTNGNNGGGNNNNGGGGNWNGNNNGGGNNVQQQCRDQNQNCHAWMQRGECIASKVYMASYCKQSCGLCGAGAGQCTDLRQDCPDYARVGHCRDSYAGIMAITCKRSCGLCGNSGSAGDYNQYQDRVQCKDSHRDCRYWWGMGHCGNAQYMEYMMITCKKSCNVCTTNSGSYGDWYR